MNKYIIYDKEALVTSEGTSQTIPFRSIASVRVISTEGDYLPCYMFDMKKIRNATVKYKGTIIKGNITNINDRTLSMLVDGKEVTTRYDSYEFSNVKENFGVSWQGEGILSYTTSDLYWRPRLDITIIGNEVNLCLLGDIYTTQSISGEFKVVRKSNLNRESRHFMMRQMTNSYATPSPSPVDEQSESYMSYNLGHMEIEDQTTVPLEKHKISVYNFNNIRIEDASVDSHMINTFLFQSPLYLPLTVANVYMEDIMDRINIPPTQEGEIITLDTHKSFTSRYSVNHEEVHDGDITTHKIDIVIHSNDDKQIMISYPIMGRNILKVSRDVDSNAKIRDQLTWLIPPSSKNFNIEITTS